MSFTSRIKNHPTVLLLRLLLGLELVENKDNIKSGSIRSVIRHPFFILFVLSSIILLIFFFTIPSKSNDVVVDSVQIKEPVDIILSSKNMDVTASKEESKDKPEVITTKVSNQPQPVKENIVQINTQRIEKLEMMLLKEQKKNKELYQKLNTQDVQLKELEAISIKDIKIASKDQKYIKSITENENTAVLDKEKVSKIDYYNKVRVLLKSELEVQGDNNLKNSQLQSLVNQLFNANKVAEESKKELKYTTSLEEESNVRNNEVRSIILKKNETLWGLAERAYGDGMKYKKIIEANPQITEKNVRFLRPGIFIRIPK